ncbi:hypothetical protein FRC10_008383 [Ceratobasidium sp. 414]|nr:hypothetical protein FRC10_008383 [Ceratobasidium sp. 414]
MLHCQYFFQIDCTFCQVTVASPSSTPPLRAILSDQSMIIPALLYVVFLGLGSAEAAPTPDASKAKCTTIRSGPLSTNQFGDASGNPAIKPYYFNAHGEAAYNSNSQNTQINAEFQTCTPNYAQEPNGSDDEVLYGRFLLSGTGNCLAVTNPSDNPPYYVSSKPCPTAQQMTTKASIPYNFVWDGTGGEIDMRWLGGTIPSKQIYQGPNPPAKYCFGQYFVNATNLQYGYDYPYLGEPNTIAGGTEDYRIHLYCGNQANGEGTGYNSFTLPNYG